MQAHHAVHAERQPLVVGGDQGGAALAAHQLEEFVEHAVGEKTDKLPVDLDDDDDVFNRPFLYAARTGEWNLTQAQADKMRDFLNRGGFFMTDDFWGSFEWQVFEQSMRRVYPDREIADIPNPDAIFHGIFDLSDRYQIPGAWGLRGRPYQNDGDTPYWRAIRDDKGRIIAGMIPNSDLGDSWEYADDPYYPERYSALGIRTTINYIAYAMSH